MRKIKILWVSSCSPLNKKAAAGGQTFNYYYDAFNSDERFDVTVVALGDEAQKQLMEERHAENKHVFIYQKNGIVEKIKKLSNLDYKYNPWSKMAGLLSNYMAHRILREIKLLKLNGYTPDVIILEWTNIVILIDAIKKIYPDCVYVASEHDVTFVGYKRKSEFYKGLKHFYWNEKFKNEKKIEIQSLKRCDLILPQNPDNIQLLSESGIEKRKQLWLIPFFNNLCSIERKSNKKDILFFGAMARPENYLSAEWFITNVMPRLEDLNVRFVILGSNPPERLKKYESERIHITGFVESLQPYFEVSCCLVAPLVLGAGIKVKIIEGLSSGVPVLTNNIGIEGIPAKKGTDYIHCEEPQEYENAIRASICGELEVIGKSGRAFIEKNYSVEASFEAYSNKLISIMEDR